jgi:acyl-CoA synthetase (AMP-forming)/AMP-acid ligase II
MVYCLPPLSQQPCAKASPADAPRPIDVRPAPVKIHQVLAYFARSKPAAAMLAGEGWGLSFGEAAGRIRRIAGLLHQAGIAPGDRIAVLGENHPDQVLLLFAAATLGAVQVPLNYRLSPAELGAIVRDAAPKALVCTSAAHSALAAGLLSGAAAPQAYCAAPQRGTRGWNEAVDSAAPLPEALDNVSADVVLQLYTSGTTGRAKGVQLTHGNLLALSFHTACGLRHKPGHGTMELVVAPLFHIGGLGTALNAILGGGAVLLHQAFEPGRVLDSLGSGMVTSAFLVPAMIQAVIGADPAVANRDFSRLRQISYGASPISESLLAQAMGVFKCDFVQYYGMTETCGAVLSLDAGDHQQAMSNPALLRSCGRPLAGVQVRIENAAGEALADGETGEIVIRSETNTPAYWGLPEETAKVLRQGWMHTGDAGYRDAQGYVYLRDRIKDMVVSGGENVYPVEVENVIAAHPAVLEVAVIGVPDEKYGEGLLAVCVLRAGMSLSCRELIDHCRPLLAGYKIPRRLELAAALPRNPSGKILKTELRKPYWAGRSRGIA